MPESVDPEDSGQENSDDPVDPDEPIDISDSAGAESGTTVVRRRRREQQGSEDSLGYVPALDGLRAIAVIAVLFFHARFTWIPGGFLGVSTFFTLSGFLITTLMLQEHKRSGEINLRGFYRRRFRRLLPASWLTLALVVSMAVLGVWSTGQLRSLRLDIPWSMAELVNWHFIFDSRSYGDQFEAPSPVEHFWSLAVEQQFYLILPAVVLGVLAWGKRRESSGRVALGSILAVALVGSAILNGFFAEDNVARSYFGTDTRLAELAAGALLAVIGVARIKAVLSRFPRLTASAGAIAVLGTIFLWNTATVNTGWLYPWGLLATAATSVLFIGVSLNKGWLGAALSVAPLVLIGRISYGIYLLHWPIFLWLNPTRTGLSQWPLFGLRVSITLAAAAVMFKFFESPIRSGQWLKKGAARKIALPAAALILITGALVTSDLPEPSELASAESTEEAAPPPAPTRVLFIGDQLIGNLAEEMIGTEEFPLEVTVASSPDCGAALGGWVQLSSGLVERDVDRCGVTKDLWRAATAQQRPDVVVLWTGVRDVANRRHDPAEPWSGIGQPDTDDFLAVELRELLTDLKAGGAAVMVGTVPYMYDAAAAPEPAEVTLPAEPTRAALTSERHLAAVEDAPIAEHTENVEANIDRWNALIKESAQRTQTEILDLAGNMAKWPDGEFNELWRSLDGIGLTAEGGFVLGEEIAEILKEAKPPPPKAANTTDDALQAQLPPAPPLTPRRTVSQGSTTDILTVGDSVAHNFGYGLSQWSDNTAGARVRSAGQLGCPVARGGQYRFLREPEAFKPDCDWAVLYPQFMDDGDPEVVLLGSGIWEVVDRRLPGDDTWRRVGEPEIDHYILTEFLSAIDLLGSRGAHVAVTTYPHFEAGRDQGYEGLPESDPARVDRLNELLAEAVSLRPGVATLIDFQGWLAAQPGGELDPAKRSDGLHFADEYTEVIGEWLGPQLTALAQTE